MNRLQFTFRSFPGILFLLFAFVPLSGQPFLKKNLYEMARNTLRERIKWETVYLSNADSFYLAAPFPKHPPLHFREGPENLSQTADPESEIHATINPLDSNNLIVAAMKWTPGIIGEDLSFPIYHTRNFGQSWQLSDYNGVNALPEFAVVVGGGDPVLSFDGEGTAYFSCLLVVFDVLEFSFEIVLQWAVSTDGGTTWEQQPTPIDSGTLIDLEDPQSRVVDKQWMAADQSVGSPFQNTLYTAYAEINLRDTTYNLLVKRKLPEADTFEAAVDILPEDYVFAQFTSVDIGREGDVHVLFTAAAEEDLVVSLYHTSSADGGRSFSVPVRIAPASVPCFPPGSGADCPIVGIDPDRMYPCPQLRIDRSAGPHSGNLYTTWTADGGTSRQTNGVDIYFSRSGDGGASWSTPRILNDDDLPDTHQFFSSLFVNDRGLLVVGWYDGRADTSNAAIQFYLTTSGDGGETFAASFPVSTTASDFSNIGVANSNFGIGEYTQIVASSSFALPFWADGRTNDGNIEIYTARVPFRDPLSTSIGLLGNARASFGVEGPFPNPAIEQTRLIVTADRTLPVSFTVYDHIGRVVRPTRSVRLSKGTHHLDFDLQDLSPGWYLIDLQTNSMRVARLLLVPK